MAVDQPRHLGFFKDMATYNNANLYNTAASFHGVPVAPSAAGPNEGGIFLPFYPLNDVVLNKLPPAVKDDSGVTFNNSFQAPAAASSRKRPREAPQISCAAVPPLLTVNPLASSCSSICNNNNDSVVSNKNPSKSNGAGGFSFLGEDLSLQIMQQQLEIECLLSQHMEKMRVELEQRKKQQLCRTMAAIQHAVSRSVRDKEEEIARVTKINLALEERVRTLCAENQIWRDLAQTNEATANALRTNLEQVLNTVDQAAAARELQDDAVSCCGSSGAGARAGAGAGAEEEEGEAEGGGKKWVYRGENCGEKSRRRMCRSCGAGESSVLLLPCRHLCVCAACGPAVNSCPVCNSVKNASVHVNLS